MFILIDCDFSSSECPGTIIFNIAAPTFKKTICIFVSEQATIELYNRDGLLYCRIPALIKAFSEENLNVSRIIAAQYYCIRSTTLSKIFHDMEWVENNFPELDYKKKYYSCMLNQYEKSIFMKKRT